MKKIPAIFSCFFFISIFSIAQKKELTYEQAFKNAPTNILKPLPQITWIDDEHFKEINTENGKTISLIVEAKTGKTSPYQFANTIINAEENLSSDEQDPETSSDGKWVAFTRKNNLFAKELNTGKEIQFTNDGSDDIYSGYAPWVYYEEMFGRSRKAFWWSPDSKHICFIHFDESEVPLYTIFNSEGKHGSFEKYHYPQAGDKNPAVKFGIVSVADPKIVWADFNEKDDQYFGPPIWLPDGSSVWAQWIPRCQREVKIFSIDINNGSKKQVYEEKQRTWVTAKYNIDFLESSKQFIISSDKSGWDHLYLYNLDGKLVNQITQGNFSALAVEHIDEKNKLIYFLASKENAARTDFYKIGFDGSGMTRLTFGNYSHDNISLSPNAKYFITTYSNISTPPKMALVDTKGQFIREIADSKGSEFENYDSPKTEEHIVTTNDGLYNLPMQIIYPLHFDPNKKYPVMIEVYGGPGLGAYHDGWNTDMRTHWWAKEGLIQVTMDYRSSGHFGKTGMDFIYNKWGNMK